LSLVNGNCTVDAPSPKELAFVTEARCAVEHFVQTLGNSMKCDIAVYFIH
jgi:hypothetical protein